MIAGRQPPELVRSKAQILVAQLSFELRSADTGFRPMPDRAIAEALTNHATDPHWYGLAARAVVPAPGQPVRDEVIAILRGQR